ncbi:MAG: hypothetical protein RL701_6856 [Pseudomonadota bacterium]
MPDVEPAVTEAALLANRYQVQALLGRGGMACVQRVKDLVTGREVALKQLIVEHALTERKGLTALFEREFHTLAQLQHPHVIAVYDYGLLADQSPYYTMELLDGGDLRDRAPVPWREACRLLFDVCSSLALIHSRRLLHRDVSPCNIRCTQDGRAKLIDFGAMAPMSAGGADVVGTPAFVATETLQRLALDARTDLFSLGATLYHALTGQVPFRAQTFAQVLAAWSGAVIPPSSLTPDVPAALDDLVLALISIEPALRPHSAFEVMQRLAAIADLKLNESDAVSRAYLATPSLVGRGEALERFRQQLLAARMARGGAVLIEGRVGAGRSRLLDACALEGKTLGFTVMRANTTAAREPFSAVMALTGHLLESLPTSALGPAAQQLLVVDPAQDPELLQRAICKAWLDVSCKHALLFSPRSRARSLERRARQTRCGDRRRVAHRSRDRQCHRKRPVHDRGAARLRVGDTLVRTS